MPMLTSTTVGLISTSCTNSPPWSRASRRTAESKDSVLPSMSTEATAFATLLTSPCGPDTTAVSIPSLVRLNSKSDGGVLFVSSSTGTGLLTSGASVTATSRGFQSTTLRLPRVVNGCTSTGGEYPPTAAPVRSIVAWKSSLVKLPKVLSSTLTSTKTS